MSRPASSRSPGPRFAVAFALLALLPGALSAQRPAVRSASQILAFPVAGVTLDTPVDDARAILADDGFVEVSIYGPPSAPAGWNYEKGTVRVVLRHRDGVLQLVERIDQGRADSDTVDVDGPARHIREYFELTDDDCRIVDESMACSVADTETRPAVVATAQLVSYRTIVRATRVDAG